jgi:L-threonylcarbamoyladenylate synthase
MKTEAELAISHAKKALEAGKLVAIPTETVYGLAANGLDEQAVTRIFLAKNRPQFNPLILHIGNIQQAESLISSWNNKSRLLAEAFWPGPLTLLMPRSPLVPDLVTAGSPLVAVRMPKHPLTLKLLQALDFPLAAPSANPSGYISPTSAAHVREQLGDKVSYILDGGEAGIGIESTIIGFDEAGNPLLYRLGGLALEAIEAVAGPVTKAGLEDHKPATPGRLEKHYAPVTAFIVGSPTELLWQYRTKNIGVLAWNAVWPGVAVAKQRVLSSSGDTAEAARNLFRMMRELDAMGLDVILTEKAPPEGLGPAINDRLRRASYDEIRRSEIGDRN